MKKMKLLRIKVNGTWVETLTPPSKMLLDFIRDDLNLTGTKKGCGKGDCGSCVVLYDGRARTTCNIPVSRANGHEIITIEGLADGQRLHPIQESFIEAGAIQCGYCTPGMVMRAKDLLDHHPNPSKEEIECAISGHVCRCTGYVKIVEAIHLASKKMTQKA